MIASISGLVLAVGILYALQQTKPGYADITKPIAVHGTIGDRLMARNFELTATKVTLAQRIVLRTGTKEQVFETTGLWAVVEAKAAARHESVTVIAASWRGPSGSRYAMSQRFSTMPGLLPSERLEPGLPRNVLMLFELPENQVKDATILVSRTPFAPIDNELHIKANVPIPLFVRNVARVTRGSTAGDWRLEIQ
ncbi:MAG TPA: hypothetical protein VJR58_31380 [Vineibacter sp.]|nr:hypothetical protein [Vineibacter sp.]